MNHIRNVYTAHTINSVALSVIGIYIPAYLLTLNYPLDRVIIFFAISHLSGLIIGLTLYVSLFKKIGVINTFKLYYPLQLLYLTMLFALDSKLYPLELVAILYGTANYAYWMPLNLLFLKFSESESMGNNLSKLFALPKFFGIIGPLIGAVLIPIFGFWPIFIIAFIGIFASFIPLSKMRDETFKITLNFKSGIKRILHNKTLFMLEAIDNIIEESEWFWAIYVYILLDSLTVPGIIGSLEALGGAAFTLLVGKVANKKAKLLIPISAVILILISLVRIFISDAISVYAISIAASFVMTLFLVSYFTTIYKTVKGEGEEEFVILREIPTVMGRMAVFTVILISTSNLNLFFIFPSFILLLLLVVYLASSKHLSD